MKAGMLNEAISEAERFLVKAKACRKSARRGEHRTYFESKDASAVKRASMDLTRSLADLRQKI